VRATRRDPCKGCGITIEHDGKPFDVECSYCAIKVGRDPFKKQPPPPPPLRNPNAGHDHSGVIVWVTAMMCCVAFGILIGWKMHG